MDAVDLGRLVAFGRQHLQAGQDQERHERRGLPDVDDDHGGQRGVGDAVQAIGWSMKPRPCRMTLMIPNTSLNIHDHIWAETTVGIAQGIRTAAAGGRGLEVGVQRQGDAEAQDGLDGDRADGEDTSCCGPPPTSRGRE